jgi:ABC-type transporter Mla maintaining outer membrane lipid asymmetry permease subunit MlaE
MRKDDWVTTLFIVFLVVTIIGGVYFNWYKAGVQSRLYEREGISVTQWEIFIGSKPAERTVNVK